MKWKTRCWTPRRVSGYLITGNEAYLKPYLAAMDELDRQMDTLKKNTTDNRRQQERIAKLGELATLRLGTLKKAIDLRRASEEQARLFVLNDAGNVQMEAIRKLVDQMRNEERDLLKERQIQSKVAYETALTTCLLTTVIGLALVGAFAWLLRHSVLARRKAAAVLHEQREWFRITLAGIGDAVIATDTDGNVQFLNPIAQNLTAWSAEDAQGRPLETVFTIVNEETRQSVENPALRAVREGVIVGLANHTILIARDGTERPIDDSVRPDPQRRWENGGGRACLP